MSRQLNDGYGNLMHHLDNQRREQNQVGSGETLVDFMQPTIAGVSGVKESPDWSAVGQTLLRLSPKKIEDGIWSMEDDLTSAGEIRDAVVLQDSDLPSSFVVSDLFWVSGQFTDRDIVLSETGSTYTPNDFPEDGSALAENVSATENSSRDARQTLFTKDQNWWIDTLSVQRPDYTPDQLFDARIPVENET